MIKLVQRRTASSGGK